MRHIFTIFVLLLATGHSRPRAHNSVDDRAGVIWFRRNASRVSDWSPGVRNGPAAPQWY